MLAALLDSYDQIEHYVLTLDSNSDYWPLQQDSAVLSGWLAYAFGVEGGLEPPPPLLCLEV